MCCFLVLTSSCGCVADSLTLVRAASLARRFVHRALRESLLNRSHQSRLWHRCREAGWVYKETALREVRACSHRARGRRWVTALTHCCVLVCAPLQVHPTRGAVLLIGGPRALCSASTGGGKRLEVAVEVSGHLVPKLARGARCLDRADQRLTRLEVALHSVD